MFILKKTASASRARLGELITEHGTMATPCFMTIATKGAVKTLSSFDVQKEGAEILLANTYHLYLRPGMEIINTSGGLHNFMKWSGPILTDSGGYQVFSLSKMRTITEEGVAFQSPWDGSKHLLTPERSLEVQKILGSDIAMVFDECPPHPATREYIKNSLERTTRWAERSKQEFSKRDEELPTKKQFLFGIVQGSVFDDLRKISAQALQEIGFDGYALGGLAVGEEKDIMYDVIENTEPCLPKDKPRYLMGVGKPENIIEAVKRGMDMFDCVIPTRNARHGLVYIFRDRKNILTNSAYAIYETLHVTGESNKKNQQTIDPSCACFTCAAGFTRAYIHHLFRVQEPLALRLTTIHNIRFYLDMMQQIREEI